MTRNQKIAVGCGVAAVAGLLILMVACVVAYFVWRERKPPSLYSRNYNFNSNYNSNNRNLNSSSNDSDTSSTMSDDEKHRLFQAAGLTQDSDLIIRVMKKIGLMTPSGSTSDDYAQFMKDHYGWAVKNYAFIKSVNTPEKARAYVDEHIDD